MAIAGMTRYDRRMKVAISLPDEVLERLDSAAESAGLNRSEFFRTAGLRFALDIEGEGPTHLTDAHLSQVPVGDADEDSAHGTRGSRAGLDDATDGDAW